MLSLFLAGLCFAADDDEDELVASEERVSVLVSEFQAKNEDGKALAALVESYLAGRLSANSQVKVVRPEDLPPFQDYPTRTYLEACPSGEIVGCTYVAAERGQVDWAITGTTRVLPGASKVEVSVLDIHSGKVVISFETELESGQNEAFADAVAKVLADAIAGSFKERDIRETEDEGDTSELSDEEVAAQLAALSQELGGTASVTSREDELIERPSYTMEDLAASMKGEGTKPWERLGMTPGEYLRYKNSDKTLMEWRSLAAGRAQELILRPALGFGVQPSSSIYYGRYTYDTGAVVDSYTANAVQNSFGGFFNLGLAYGIHPMVDIGADIGVATGRITMDLQQQTIGQQALPPDTTDFFSRSIVVGPRVTAGFFPVSPVRPVVSAAALFYLGDRIDNHIFPPDNLALFPAPTTIVAEAMIGGEARITRSLDFFVHVPIDITVGGSTFREVREGTADVVEIVGAPTAPGIFSAGMRAGFQVRLLGKNTEGSVLDEFEEEP